VAELSSDDDVILVDEHEGSAMEPIGELPQLPVHPKIVELQRISELPQSNLAEELIPFRLDSHWSSDDAGRHSP
jgi:hypothetical protein